MSRRLPDGECGQDHRSASEQRLVLLIIGVIGISSISAIVCRIVWNIEFNNGRWCWNIIEWIQFVEDTRVQSEIGQ